MPEGIAGGAISADGLTPRTETGFPGAADAARDFRLMADSLPTLCWIANADGYIFWYNRRWHEYCGTTPAEMAGWGWQSVHDPAVLPEVMTRWQAAIDASSPFEMTFPLRGHDGTYRPFLTRVEPVRDSGGAVVRWYGMNTDVSGQVALENRLDESEAALRAFFETAGIYTAILDLDDDDFTFVVANRRMAKFWGADDVAGRRAREISKGRLPRTMMPVLHAAAVSEKPSVAEYPFEGPDGQRWFNATLTPMPPGRAGKPRLAIASLDITQRKRAEAALAQAVETKDVLLHEVNHRVKNSLQLVNALLSLQAAQSAEPRLRASLLEARNRVAVVASMHQRLYSTSAHDRVELIGYLRELASENAEAHGTGGRVALDFKADGELVMPLTQAVPLALVVSELLTNAFKYAFPGDARGTVRVAIEQSDGAVGVSVADDGIGLPADFSMVRAGSLGMKIVRSLTRQIGATVRIENAAPGARFVVDLPGETSPLPLAGEGNAAL